MRGGAVSNVSPDDGAPRRGGEASADAETRRVTAADSAICMPGCRLGRCNRTRAPAVGPQST